MQSCVDTSRSSRAFVRISLRSGRCWRNLYKAEEQKYIESFKKINVPLDDVMKNFK